MVNHVDLLVLNTDADEPLVQLNSHLLNSWEAGVFSINKYLEVELLWSVVCIYLC